MRRFLLGLSMVTFGLLGVEPSVALTRLEKPRLTRVDGRISALLGANGDTLRFDVDAAERELDGCVEMWHMFLGTYHTRRPTAQPLPLWGEGEKLLLDMISEAIADTIDTDAIGFLQSNRAARYLPDSLSVELWHLVRTVHRRLEQIHAVETGSLADPVRVLSDYGMDASVAIWSITTTDSTLTVQLVDSYGNDMWVTLMPQSGRWNSRFNQDSEWGSYEAFGCWMTLGVITLSDLALRNTDFDEFEPNDREALTRFAEIVRESRIRTLEHLREASYEKTSKPGIW